MTAEPKKTKTIQLAVKPAEIQRILGPCPMIEGPAILRWFKAFKEMCDDYEIEDELSVRAKYLRVCLPPEHRFREHWPAELPEEDDLDDFFSTLLNEAFPPENLRRTLVADLEKTIAPNFNGTVLDAHLHFLDGTFLALEHLGEDYTDAQKCDILLKTLPQHIRKNIREDINITTYAQTRTKLYRLATTHAVDRQAPATLNLATTAGRTQKSQAGQQKSTPLTPEERARCDTSGLCYICRQPGHLARDCPKRRPRPAQQLNNVEAATAAQGNDQPSA
jgi:hypothetical protein